MPAARLVAPLLLPHGRFFGAAERRADVGGFALALMTPDPVRPVTRHTHETAHWILLLAGPYRTTARGAPALVVGPTLVYNPPGTTHQDRFASTDGRFVGHFLSLAVAPDRMVAITEQVPLADEAMCVRDGHALALAGRLARECRTWGPVSPLVAEGLCLELMAAVARRPVEDEHAASSWVRRARDLLQDRCADALTIRDVAAAAGVHPVHLARAFRRVVGCTPGDYLRRCRLERGAALLRDTAGPVSAVALAAGFADQSQFGRAFRRAYGVTPTAYRDLLRGGPRAARRAATGTA